MFLHKLLDQYFILIIFAYMKLEGIIRKDIIAIDTLNEIEFLGIARS